MQFFVAVFWNFKDKNCQCANTDLEYGGLVKKYYSSCVVLLKTDYMFFILEDVTFIILVVDLSLEIIQSIYILANPAHSVSCAVPCKALKQELHTFVF